MMNKNKTSQLHLLRLLLLLPVTIIIVLAFQPRVNKEKGMLQDGKIITITGLIMDAETLQPLPSANLVIEDKTINVTSDEKRIL